MKGFAMKVEYGKLSSQFLIAALLATGTGAGYLKYHQPVILADSASDSLEITQTQAVNFIDQQSGKVVGSQQLVLQKNRKTFASDTKLKLPSGYKRADKFTYDLSGGDSKDSHYTVAKDGKITWNVYVSKDSDQQESGSNAKTITSTNTTHNNAAKLLDPNGGNATTSSTQVSKAKSTQSSKTSGSPSAASSTTNANSNNNESATSSASILEPNGSSASNTPATSSSPATSSANVGATSGSSSAANSSSSTPTSGSASTDNVSNNGQNSQTLPQTSADQATPAAEEAIGLGLAGVLAGIGLGHVIVKHHSRKKNE